MEESRTGRKDPCWKYSTPDPNDKNTVTCNFCGKQTKGGIFRAKKHLVGGFRDVKKCPLCPPSVRKEIASFMSGKTKDKEAMGMTSFSRNVHGFGFAECDECEDVGDEMLFKQIKASVGIESSKGYKRKENFKGPMDAFLSVNAEHSTRKALAMKNPRCDAVEKCAIWLISSGICFELIENPNFQQAWNLLCQFGLEPVAWEPPSVHELSLVLQDEKKKMDAMLKSHKEEWAKYGCTLILDGWHDGIENKDILNVLVNSSKGMVFLMSVDVSKRLNDAQKLFFLLDTIVKYVGVENVVQVVTDNASPYAAAVKLLEMQRAHLFWSPCATQCIVELMLEDIGKIPRIRGAIMNAVFLNSYLYSQIGALNLLKKYSGKRELMRPAVTRFATTFITLKSVREQKHNLRRMVVSDDWRKKKWSKEIEAKKCVRIVLKESFWRDVVYALKLTIPLVKVLALVYSVKPSMGHIYGAIDQAKGVIMKSFNYNEEKCKEAIEIIDKNWKCQLHQPLHAAGHFFNPSIFLDGRQAILENHDIMNALHHCIERLACSQDEKDAINLELAMYQNAESIFGLDVLRQSKTRSPVDWWEQYGNVVPHLQKLAITILSLSCSATRHEKSWDTFQKLHSDFDVWERPRHKNMLFVRYNLALIRQHDYQNEIDSLLTNNIDESNEWLVGIMDDATEDEANEPHYLSWFNVEDTFRKLSIPEVDKEEEEVFDDDDGEEGEDGFDLELPVYSEDEDDMEGDF